MKTYVCAKIYWQMFIAALFVLAKKLETPQMSTNRSTDERAEVRSHRGVLAGTGDQEISGGSLLRSSPQTKRGRPLGLCLHEILQKARLTHRARNRNSAWGGVGVGGGERPGILLGPSGWKSSRLWWVAGPGPTHVSGTRAAEPDGWKQCLNKVPGQVLPPPPFV